MISLNQVLAVEYGIAHFWNLVCEVCCYIVVVVVIFVWYVLIGFTML